MKATHLKEILEALGGKNIEVSDQSDQWAMLKVNFQTPAGFVKARYLYLAYDCPQLVASEANKQKWRSGGEYTVIATTRSALSDDLAKTKIIFGGIAATNPRKLLVENVMQNLVSSNMESDNKNYFIHPIIKLENGKEVQAVSHIVETLKISKKHSEIKNWAEVLIADAGLGKTTVCRIVADELFKDDSNIIPILVESAQWQGLVNVSLPNILYNALLQLMPDALHLTNPKLFRLLATEQILIPIFDGFDELSVLPETNHSAENLLKQLSKLIGNSGAKVLMSARKTFWENNIDGVDGIDKNKLNKLELLGFTNTQRQQFFKKRLKRSQDIDLANRISKEIGSRLYEDAVEGERENKNRASGIPLMLELIAVYVDHNDLAKFLPNSKDPIGPLLKSICDRENLRQKLKIPSTTQMKIFEELYVEFPKEFSKDELKFIVELHVPDVSSSKIERFSQHAFFATNNDMFDSKFETLRIYFVARWLARQLEDSLNKKMSNQTSKILKQNALGKGELFDELVIRIMEPGKKKYTATIKHAYEMITASEEWEGPCSALFHLSQEIALKNKITRFERSNVLLGLMGTKNEERSAFNKVAVEGTISSLDLRETSFENCVFKNVEFYNCKFNKTTEFINSRFQGTLNFSNCSKVDNFVVSDCIFSTTAKGAVDKYCNNAAHKVSRDAAIEALLNVLRKFKSQFGLSGIQSVNAKSGVVGKSPYRDVIYEALQSEGILKTHDITGVKNGGVHISEDESIRHEIKNFQDNALLGPTLKRVLSKIIKQK